MTIILQVKSLSRTEMTTGVGEHCKEVLIAKCVAKWGNIMMPLYNHDENYLNIYR